MSLISVIVPVFNTGPYLKRCIDSILDQDYPDLEIIIVDDGSSDTGTIEMCDEYGRRYERISTYHKRNGGSASARNYGISRASGEYIGFVDSDDAIEPNMYSTLYQDIESNQVKVALGGMQTVENNKVIDKLTPIPTGVYGNEELMHYFLLGHFHSACTNLYSAELFGNVLFPENEINEDFMLNYLVFRDLDKVYVNETVLYHYLRRQGSNTSSPACLKFLDWLKHTEYVLHEQRDKGSLIKESEYQYLFSNIVLANKSLLTLSSGKSDDASKLFSVASGNLHNNWCMLVKNRFLNIRYRAMGLFLALMPSIYRKAVLIAIVLKSFVR